VRLPVVAAILLVCCAVACSRERPPPEPVTFESVKFKKIVVWVQDGEVLGHFGLENERDKPLAMAGKLTLTFFADAKINVQDGGPAFEVKSEMFRLELPVRVADFQWIYYHSFLTEDDFICRFKVSLGQFKNRPVGGRFIRLKLSFKPDVYPTTVEEERRLWIPSES
jgi:hypothetical protein